MAEVWQAGFFNDYEREFLRTFDKHFNDVINNFLKGEKPPIHAQKGKRALQIAIASINSMKSNKSITL